MVEKIDVILKSSWGQRKEIKALERAFREACYGIWAMGLEKNNFTIKDLTDHVFYTPPPFPGLAYSMKYNPWKLPTSGIHAAIATVATTYQRGEAPDFNNNKMILGPSAFSFIDPNTIQIKVLDGKVLKIPVVYDEYAIKECQPGTPPGFDWLENMAISRSFNAQTTNPPIPPYVQMEYPIEGTYHRSTILTEMPNFVDGIDNPPQYPDVANLTIWQKKFGLPVYITPRGVVGSVNTPALGGRWVPNNKVYLSQIPALSGKMMN